MIAKKQTKSERRKQPTPIDDMNQEREERQSVILPPLEQANRLFIHIWAFLVDSFFHTISICTVFLLRFAIQFFFRILFVMLLRLYILPTSLTTHPPPVGKCLNRHCSASARSTSFPASPCYFRPRPHSTKERDRQVELHQSQGQVLRSPLRKPPFTPSLPPFPPPRTYLSSMLHGKNMAHARANAQQPMADSPFSAHQ